MMREHVVFCNVFPSTNHLTRVVLQPLSLTIHWAHIFSSVAARPCVAHFTYEWKTNGNGYISFLVYGASRISAVHPINSNIELYRWHGSVSTPLPQENQEVVTWGDSTLGNSGGMSLATNFDDH